MPRVALPPTPAASAELKGSRQNQALDKSDSAFTLPPSAVSHGSSAHPNGPNKPEAPDDAAPMSPTSPDIPSGQRHKSQADVALPPPPSRSRKIIQMKPKAQPSQPRRSTRAEAQAADKTETAQATPGSASSGAGGKKAPSSNTAAGRKVARKTAHSIIERRRRSKMNEEFGVLKDLIPACRGCEMHKLAILQASIDYLRYLEQCVEDLKANQGQQDTSQVPSVPTSSMRSSQAEDLSDEAEEEDDDNDDDEMDVDDVQEDTIQPPAGGQSISPPPSTFTSMTSPAFSAQSYHSHHRGSTATLPSPVFGPYIAQDPLRPSTTHSSHSYAGSRASFSNQPSPNIAPLTNEQTEDLNEASTALLMLNAKDRRNTGSSLRSPDTDKSGQRGISVKDLLRS